MGATAGDAWASGLEQTAAGLVPRFELSFLSETILAVHTEPRWDEWAGIDLPILDVRGGHGFLPPAEADRMLTSNHNARRSSSKMPVTTSSWMPPRSSLARARNSLGKPAVQLPDSTDVRMGSNE